MRSARRLALAGAAVVWLGVAAAGQAGAIEPPPTPEPPDPRPQICVSRTTLSRFTSSGDPFRGGTTLTWSVSKGCPEVTITLAGQVVGASGSRVVDPAFTSSFGLEASMGTSTKDLGSKIAVGGDIVSYVQGRGGLAPYYNGSGEVVRNAAEVAGRIISAVSEPVKQRLLGKALEVHLIPARHKLTRLPPWRHLAGTISCDENANTEDDPDSCVAPRRFDDVPGVGGTLVGGNRIVLAAGEETLIQRPDSIRPRTVPYNTLLAHELGHTVLDFGASPTQTDLVRQALAAHDPASSYLGHFPGEGIYIYLTHDIDEFFADATSAMFRYPCCNDSDSTNFAQKYTPEHLAAREPGLFSVLRQIYPLAS